MSDPTSLTGIGEWAKPANTLLEMISNLGGGWFKPFQLKRVSKAKAEITILEANTRSEVAEIDRRAFNRFVAEQSKEQLNIEAIGSGAMLLIEDGARPENIDDDWFVNFFDKCRLISNKDMQQLWSRILAGEANNPGTFSRRTVNTLETLDRKDAELFTSFCGFCIDHTRDPRALIYSNTDDIYTRNGINFSSLKHLDEIGLITFNSFTGFKLILTVKEFGVTYFDKKIELISPEKKGDFATGSAMLSKVGKDIASICDANPVNGFLEYLFEYWKKQGIDVSLI